MKYRKKYFVLNKESDFRRGRLRGLEVCGQGLRLEKGKERGVYYSGVFDSREKQTLWHRFLVEGDGKPGVSVDLTVYGSESRMICAGRETADVESMVTDEGISDEEIDTCMEACKQAEFSGFWDVLLYEVKGRYLWFKLVLKGDGRQGAGIRRMRILFPKDTWLKYLPEIYEEDGESASFLERYLGIFQSVYEDMTDRIEQQPLLLNPWTAGRQQLEWMAQWLAVENRDIWNEEQLRFLVANGVRLYQYRGTVLYMKEILKLYTGEEPYIVENHQLEPFFDKGPGERRLKHLYGREPWEFTVLLRGKGVEGRSQENQLRQIIDMAKPANMECRVVILKPYIFLGQHSYVGINSVLGRYGSFQLNGLCAVPFAAIADNQRRKHL